MRADSPQAIVEVRLTPRSSRDELGPWRDGVLQARVRAAPVDGKANEALCRLVAAATGIAPSQVAVVAGAASRRKRLVLTGISFADAIGKLGG